MTTQKRRFFNLDLHISVIEDIKYICSELYKENVEIVNWSISGHNWVFQKPEKDVVAIHQGTWKHINESMIHAFQDYYDEELKTYDGFIVTHTPVFAMLFEKYNKPILVVNTCRYDQPFCWTKDTYMLDRFHDCLRKLQREKRLSIVSNNAADKAYLYERTGIDSIHIPSLCLYTNATYTGKHPQFVVFQKSTTLFPNHPLLTKLSDRYSWQDLYDYKGIIHTPYEMSTMSIFEQFWRGIPLFFPTKRFYKQCLKEGSMEFISLYHKWGQPISETEIDVWLDKADWYAFPGLYYYDSVEDLFKQLETFQDIHADMRSKWIEAAKGHILTQWKTILSPLIENQLYTKQRIEVVMRMCPDSTEPINGGGRPSWFSKRACFDQLFKTKDEFTTITVLFDGPIEGHWITTYPVKIFQIQGGTDEASIVQQLSYMRSLNISDDTILYSLEDDYVHRNGWPDILREGFSASLPFDYVTLYDHRDKYTLGMYTSLVSKIAISNSVHWRTTPSTTNTWSCLFKTFCEDFEVFMVFKNLDHTKFLELGRRGRLLGSCLPGWSTHAHPEHLSPCIDWSSLFQEPEQQQEQGQKQQMLSDYPFANLLENVKADEHSCDIREHLDFLCDISKSCESILECGVRRVFSSVAFAKGLSENKKPVKRLHCCDIVKSPNVSEFEILCKKHGYDFRFYEMSDLDIPMVEYDMIFIDTWHVYAQLKRELEKFHPYAKKYIVLHDTEVDGIYGESLRLSSDIAQQSQESGYPIEEIMKGLQFALKEFLDLHPEWRVKHHFSHNNGLTVLERMYVDLSLSFLNEDGTILNQKYSETDEQEMVYKYIEKHHKVLELGARKGVVSCSINKKLQDQTQQVSVEPDERVWDILETNRDRNKCKFHIVKGFLSKKKLSLTNTEVSDGYASTFEYNEGSTIPSYSLETIEQTTDIVFNALVADCEGYLETFFDENPTLYRQLELVIYERDYPEKCNYNKIEANLREAGFRQLEEGFQNVWKK